MSPQGMPYDRAGDVVRLAILLQGTWGGLTLRAVQDEFSVSRRTAERMRDAIRAARVVECDYLSRSTG